MQTRIREGGFIFTETKAKKQYQCCVCDEVINAEDIYLKVEMGGGGLGWSINPDRIHNYPEDMDKYLEKRNGAG